jgi:hypothetical protein
VEVRLAIASPDALFASSMVALTTLLPLLFFVYWLGCSINDEIQK